MICEGVAHSRRHISLEAELVLARCQCSVKGYPITPECTLLCALCDQATEAETKEDREIVCEEVFCDITGQLDADAKGRKCAVCFILMCVQLHVSVLTTTHRSSKTSVGAIVPCLGGGWSVWMYACLSAQSCVVCVLQPSCK